VAIQVNLEPRFCPALLVGAPASGQGKTTVAAGLARLHARQGRKVRVFKCGPDFIDPGWLALASGVPVHSLDLWMTGEDECAQQLWVAAGAADLLIVEGVMGLFDGKPSAADLARRFSLPVLGVIDAGAMAGTFGAMAFGLEHYQRGLRWAGVVANRVAGPTHAAMLRDALADPQDWLGAVDRDAALELPERHLGLVTPGEASDPLARIDAMADALAATPLGQMTLAQMQRWSVRFDAPPAAAPVQPLLQGTTVAVARDAAFCFIYPANLDCLRSLGAQLAFFSPLADDALPACDAVWLPGGYPELHAPALGRNRAMAQALEAHVAAGKPLWAECGGMMALFEQLRTLDGDDHPLWGLLPGRVAMQPRLAGIGNQQLSIDGLLLRGHSFHHSTCDTALAPLARTFRPGSSPNGTHGEALYARAGLRASYFHAWFASSAQATASLFTPARAMP
jgi:cobyrinic acid a,c-diamide synthase